MYITEVSILFQALLIKIPFHYFKRVQSLFVKFIWAHSKPRLSRDEVSPCLWRDLTLSKHYRGLALPDLQNNYLAVHLGRVIDWNRHYKTKLWAQLEQAQTRVKLKGALWCYDRLPSKLKSHPILGTTLQVGSLTVFKASLTTRESPLFPVLGNPAFLLGFGQFEYEYDSLGEQRPCFSFSRQQSMALNPVIDQ